MSTFASALIAWQRRHGRRGLPWQGTRDPYRIWLSEVMLQQTQVSAVIPYYHRFLKRFPTVRSLAGADENDVLQLWSGLGYYARGRNLHKAAREIAAKGFPRTAEEIAGLPGVGRSTAAAIAAFAFGERAAILDGNVKRVLARHAGIRGFPRDKPVEARLWKLAERRLPQRDIGTYTQALMDLGATLCTRTKPRCDACPVRAGCLARKEGLTARIPAPRPKKAIPARQARWLVLLHKGRVLLERRPPTGIWGGLWCFPEANGARHPGFKIARTRELEPIEHGFSHFRLTIYPLLCEVSEAKSVAEAPGRIWLDIADARRAAAPAPVKKLLSGRRLAA